MKRNGKPILPKPLRHCPTCAQLSAHWWGMVGQPRDAYTCPECFMKRLPGA